MAHNGEEMEHNAKIKARSNMGLIPIFEIVSLTKYIQRVM